MVGSSEDTFKHREQMEMKNDWFRIILRVFGGIVSLGCLAFMILFLSLHKNSAEDIYYFVYSGLFGTASAFYALRGNEKQGSSWPWYVWLVIAWPALFSLICVAYRILFSKN